MTDKTRQILCATTKMPPKYTVSPHLNYFNVPLAQFHESRPEFESFAVGAYIFAEPHSINTATDTPNVVIPRTLLIQRSYSDTMGGCWEGPGGAVEPDRRPGSCRPSLLPASHGASLLRNAPASPPRIIIASYLPHRPRR